MILYKLSRRWEAGFNQGSVVIGYYTSKLLARKQAEAIEPRKDVRDYEFGYERIKVTSTFEQLDAITAKHSSRGTKCTPSTPTKRKSSKRTLKSRG